MPADQDQPSLQPSLTRRRFLAVGATGLAALAVGACDEPTQPDTPLGSARLFERPGTPTETTTPGTHQLGVEPGRDGLLYVPANYSPAEPAPLVVLFHGASGSGAGALPLLQWTADESNLVLLAPDSRGRSWDLIEGSYGDDIAFLDAALRETFGRVAIDPTRIAVGGFSDGASYALSVGLSNGDLFDHVLAFSPGFQLPSRRQGRPRVFISHGIQDPVLPIGRTSRRIVPELRRRGYEVRYEEYAGGHSLPPQSIRDVALDFLIDGWASD